MKVQELHAHLQRDGLGPLYLVMGEEPFFRDLALGILRQAISKVPHADSADPPAENASEPFNCDILYGDETDASEILSLAEEVSFFGARRMIMVKWAEKLSARDGEALIPYLQSPNPSATLIVAATKLDGRTKWVQELKKRATVIDCAPLFDNQRGTWVAQQARECGVRLDQSGLELLKDQAAEGLYAVRNELEKLAAFPDESRTIGAAEVEMVRGKPPGMSVFDWSEAVARGDRGKALEIVAKNLEMGEAPLRLLGAFLWQLRRVWKAKSALNQGADAKQAAQKAGIPPFRAREFIQQVERWREPQLQKAWQLLVKADSALKGGRAIAPKLVLDELVLELCRAGRDPGPTTSGKRAPFPGKEKGAYQR